MDSNRSNCESLPICPKCGKPVLDFDRKQEPPFCSPIQSPDCWRVDRVYDHGLKNWVLTVEPGEEPPTVAEMNEARGHWYEEII